MTPEAQRDAGKIWAEAREKGLSKYDKGQKEHKTQFWTAGAGWYAAQIEDEAIDLISYIHHLRERIASIKTLSRMMRDGEVSLDESASILDGIAGNSPPKKYPIQNKIRHHD